MPVSGLHAKSPRGSKSPLHSNQKPSIIQTLLLRVQPNIAKWRPSGEGTPHGTENPPMTAGERLPLRS